MAANLSLKASIANGGMNWSHNVAVKPYRMPMVRMIQAATGLDARSTKYTGMTTAAKKNKLYTE